MSTYRFEWRGEFTNDALNALHAEAFGHDLFGDDWHAQVYKHSLGWVTARDGDELVGFVNVPWDGALHAFILDTIVSAGMRRQGVGTRLVEIAVVETRKAGCEWLHADFDDELTSFYITACAFRSTKAGLIEL